MKFWVGVTDDRWFEFLAQQKPDEVNFWRPGGVQHFRAIEPGGLFLFKLHSPRNFIVGGGFFVRHTNLPLPLAWEVFGAKNGMATLAEFRQRIRTYRHDDEPNPVIGCSVLAQPFFWPENEWIPVPPDWQANIVQGRRYDTDENLGQVLYQSVQNRLLRLGSDGASPGMAAGGPERGDALYLARLRLGQGAFRVLVTESYHRRCAMTGERTLPVLQAAHIQPYAEDGPNRISNGLCLRSDLHILFDRGYLTVTPDYHIEVSRRIREEFQNGRDYYALHGADLRVLPDRPAERPDKKFIQWHNERVFVA